MKQALTRHLAATILKAGAYLRLAEPNAPEASLNPIHIFATRKTLSPKLGVESRVWSCRQAGI